MHNKRPQITTKIHARAYYGSWRKWASATRAELVVAKKGKEEEVEEIARKFYFNDFYFYFFVCCG
jgi:hypothetical protein